MSTPLALTINGKQYEVGDVSPTTCLATFLRSHHLLGTHTMCWRGGCGACTVVATKPDPGTGTTTTTTTTINSCLVPVLACVGWEITTIEALGNKYDGYHVIQERLTQHSGTQCGYCSPGMVMNMYGLSQSKESWTEEDVEHQLDGTMCRCTGYRPILDAFKSLKPQDIEDAHKTRCPTTGKACSGCCSKKAQKKDVKERSLPLSLGLKNATWHQPTTLQELLDILKGLPEGADYTLVCGNTAQGLYPETHTEYIYTANIPELSAVRMGTEALVFGANVTITRLMEQFAIAAQNLSGFSYVTQMVEMWKYVANTSVRNSGSWAGNIGIKLNHPEFKSDLLVGFLAAGATITTVSTGGNTTQYTMEELLTADVVGTRQVILELSLPPLGSNDVFRALKVRPRTTAAAGDVTAAFRMRVDAANSHTVVGTPVIVYGGINPAFNRATATEAALSGKSLEDEAVLQEAFAALASEVVPDALPTGASPEFKVTLTQTLLYRTVLGILGDSAASTVISGGSDILRPLSTGSQTFQQNTDTWPVGQPVTKLEAPIQCSGEAEYIENIASRPGELFGIFVTSTQANAKISTIDTSLALAIPGVEAFVGAADIPGVNNMLSFNINLSPSDTQPVFAEERVGYYGQPIGLILATDRDAAVAGRDAVKVTYEDIQPPVLTIEEALTLPLPPNQPKPIIVGDIEAGFGASAHVIEGAMTRGGQTHFHMETQVAVVNPTDNGYEVHSSSQWLSETQRAIGQVLGISDSQIFVSCKRLGGGFGAKIDQCNIVATAAAVGAYKTHRPVRLHLSLEDNMTIVGGREPYLCTYKVGVNDAGVLQAVQASLITDSGYTGIDLSCDGAGISLPSCYACPNWEITLQYVLTNTPVTTWCRTPGTTEGITFIENILEHVAAVLGVDPLEVRQKNLMPDNSTRQVSKEIMQLHSHLKPEDLKVLPDKVQIPKNLISDMLSQLLVKAQVVERRAQVVAFNQNNLWKKRGLSVMPMLWPYIVPPLYPFNVLVTVNARDGSVSVTHGGAEMGQGINTKVVQVAAYELGIPMDLITILPTNTHTNPNSSITGGSLGSDVCAHCVGEACKKIKDRLNTYQQESGLVYPTWQELVYAAYFAGVDISQRYVNALEEVQGYAVFGVACTEVELDVLTGHFMVSRTDILEDAGRSLSPLVDIGQVEGAFVMGQGLLTTEKLIYDSTTGKRLNSAITNYYPPYALDIPADLRVMLLEDAPNPVGIQSSKVTSEPPFCLSFTVLGALRQAVTSARVDAGVTGWFRMDTPLTNETLQKMCLVDASRLTVS